MAETVTYKGKPGAKPQQRMAGASFGINLSDIFKEDEEGTSTNLSGFDAPIQQTRTFYKGESPRTMTYKSAVQPAREVTTVGPAPQAQAAVPTPEMPKAAEIPFADQYLQNFSNYDQGEQGLFGGQDVDYLRSKGVSDADIRKIADQRSSVQPLPAAVYQRLGGVTPAQQSTPSSPPPQTAAQNYLSGAVDVGAQGIFGGQDVRALLSQGASQDEVRATARAIRNSGQTLPNAVYRELGQF